VSTPFSSFANATVTFKVRSSVPVYGAFGHLEDNLVDYTVSCFLEQKKAPMSNLMNEANQEEIYVEGRCISPKVLSADIQPEVLGDATVRGIPYKFRYAPSIASAFYQENEILGQRINGYLIRTTVWGGQKDG
jgi:hypothetical protein